MAYNLNPHIWLFARRTLREMGPFSCGLHRKTVKRQRTIRSTHHRGNDWLPAVELRSEVHKYFRVIARWTVAVPNLILELAFRSWTSWMHSWETWPGPRLKDSRAVWIIVSCRNHWRLQYPDENDSCNFLNSHCETTRGEKLRHAMIE